MTIDPIIVAAAITAMGAMGALILYLLRRFETGQLMSRNVVRREDYEAALAVGASYGPALHELNTSVVKLVAMVERLVLRDGAP